MVICNKASDIHVTYVSVYVGIIMYFPAKVV